MRKRHHLVVGAVGIFLLVGSIVMSTAGVSGATTSHGRGGHHQEQDRDHGRGHDKCKKGHQSYGGKHDKKKCKPKPTTTTVVETTVPEETTTVPEETTTIPEETTTVPEETTTVPDVPEVQSETTELPQVQPEVLGITETPEVQAEELAFTGASNGTIAAGGAGLLLLGLALVSGVAQRRRED